MPGENLIFATSGAIDFKGIDQFLSERPQAQGYVDFLLKNYGLTRQEVVETFGGDFLVVGMGEGNRLGNSGGLFVTNIKDKSKFNTFIDLAVEQNILQELDNDVYKVLTVAAPGFSFSQGKGFGQLLVKDDLVFISQDESLLNLIKEGNLPFGGKADKEILQLLNANTLGGYFDFETIRDFSKELNQVDFQKSGI